MKNLIFVKLFCLILLNNCFIIASTNSPLLVVLLMVKNEASVIIPTLETYLSKNATNGLSDDEQIAYVIFDTGSSDGTEIIAREFLESKNIRNIVIKQEPFIDYSSSRNRGLELAEESFPGAAFILFPDAEWYLSDFDALYDYCQGQKNEFLYTDCFNIRIKDIKRTDEFYTARLFRTNGHVRFKGRVHECPIIFPGAQLPETIYFNYLPSREGQLRTEQRFKRDEEWLLQDLSENPQDLRTVYLLGQTSVCHGDLTKAAKYFTMATQMGDGGEFTYLAYYNLGEITEYLNIAAGKQSNEDWFQAMNYYLKAYELRSHRAEPLVKIANHYYLIKEMATGYLFASRACSLPYPSQDLLFINKSTYDFERHRLLGVTAWYVGEFEIGERAIRTALAARPDDSAVMYDASCYDNRNKQLALGANK